MSTIPISSHNKLGQSQNPFSSPFWSVLYHKTIRVDIRNFGPKNLWSKEIWDRQFLGPEKFGQKIFEMKKIRSMKSSIKTELWGLRILYQNILD